MHIVMLSDHETLGGAGIAATRLASALSRNHRVSRLVLFPDEASAAIRLGHETWLGGFLRRVVRKCFMPSLPRRGTPEHVHADLRRRLRKLRPDVINIHNLHAGSPWGWTPALAGVCREFAPVVWTLHDQWSFTGRCPYAFECRGFIEGCGSECPTAGEYPALSRDSIRPAWDLRRRVLEGNPDLVAVTPSRWLADEARTGLWRKHRVAVIPNGVDTDVLTPRNRREARCRLGIPEQGRTLLVVAHDLSEERKGGRLLPRIWDHVKAHGPLTLLTMGHGSPLLDHAHVTTVPLGYLKDESRKALAYSAADLFVHPAPVDNLPNVLLESLACGTPAVALPVGGVGEIIRPGATGWLAEEVSAKSLGQAVSRALAELDGGMDLRENCRQIGEHDYSLKIQGRRYEELFDGMQHPENVIVKRVNAAIMKQTSGKQLEVVDG